jgi:hypothetical protein
MPDAFDAFVAEHHKCNRGKFGLHKREPWQDRNKKRSVTMTTNYQTGTQSGNDIKEQLKEDLGSKAREASRQIHDKGKEFADKGKEKAEALSGKAADALDDFEAAADAEADELERRGWDNLSEYVRDMADGIGGLSENLRHKSVDELVRHAAELARRNTGLFVLGSIAIGFGLSRFMKAAPGANDGMGRSAASYGRDGYSYPEGESRAYADTFSSDEYRPYESH